MNQTFPRALRSGALAAAVLAVVVLAGCGSSGSSTGTNGTVAAGTAKPGGVLHIGQLSEPSTLNPSGMVETAAIEVSTQINEPLYKQNESGKIVPLLATGYKRSADGLTWTIAIRKGVTFSTGQPMTATDVAFSLEAARHSAIWAGLWEDVRAVKVLSPRSVQITTKLPMAAMLPALTSYSAAVVPANYGGVSEKEFAQHPIGTGPFMLKKWAHGQSITLVKNPDYREPDIPKANELIFENVPDDSSRISQFQSGSLDIIGQPAQSQLKSLEQAPGVTLGNYGMFAIHYIGLNIDQPVFENLKIREAVNLAIDREGIVQVADGGFGEPAGSFLPPTVPYHDDSLEAPAQDVAKAKALVQEAKMEGATLSFKVITIAGQAYSAAAAQIIQQDLAEVGISVGIEPLDISALIEKSQTGEFDAILGEYYAGVPDPSEFTSVYISSVAKPNGASLKHLEALATQASAELNSSKREALYAEIQKVVAAELQLVALDYAPAIWALQEHVVGLEVNSINSPWMNVTGFEE